MSRYIPINDKLILCIKSGRRCAMPTCRANLIPEINPDVETNISEFAHIVPFGNNGPRSKENIDVQEKNSAPNLILLCATCHLIVDKNPEIYTVEKLLKIKLDHEQWVLDQRDKEIPNVGFSELDVILKYLVSNQISVEESYQHVSIKPKIEKNNLSKQVEQSIMRGMIGRDQVKKYIDGQLDIEFGNRLRDGFVIKYNQLHDNENLDGDDTFYRLQDYAAQYSNDPKTQAAALSILVYLFEACEVFEK